MLTPTRLAVWGDPVAHSLSPALHGAAYAVLGLEWEYDRRRVDDVRFADELSALGAQWRGLSLTMPLKRVAAAAARTLDERAERTGAVNTLLLEPSGARGFNTDVGGLVRALGEQGVGEVRSARILGAGATATSALVALAELGARRVEVVARRPDAARALQSLGEALGLLVVTTSFAAAHDAVVEVTIGTLPGDTDLGDASARLAATGGLLLDVVYGQWPTALARAWERAGRDAVSGRGMLLHQALLQVRVFVTGATTSAVDDEPAVLAAMRSALMGD
jgi:shikimate dehydrogenase